MLENQNTNSSSKYIKFGIRVNIAIFLFVILVGFLLPVVLIPIVLALLPSLISNPQILEIVSVIIGLLFSFAVDYYVFKRTYKNAKEQDKSFNAESCVLYTIVVSAILNVIVYFITETSKTTTIALIQSVLGFAIAALAFYLASQKVDRELEDMEKDSVMPTGMQENSAQQQTPLNGVNVSSSGLATASLILGIISFIPLVGLMTGLIAIVLGIFAMKQIKQTQCNGKGLAKGGIILGILGMIFTVVLYGSLFYLGFIAKNGPFVDSKIMLTQQILNQDAGYLELYKKNHGDYPDTLSELSQNGYTIFPTDSYIRPLYYKVSQDHQSYDLRSLGQDGLYGSEDNILPSETQTATTQESQQISISSSGSDNSVDASDTAALEQSVLAKASELYPPKEFTIFQSQLEAARSQPGYAQALAALNASLDNLNSALSSNTEVVTRTVREVPQTGTNGSNLNLQIVSAIPNRTSITFQVTNASIQPPQQYYMQCSVMTPNSKWANGYEYDPVSVTYNQPTSSQTVNITVNGFNPNTTYSCHVGVSYPSNNAGTGYGRYSSDYVVTTTPQ